MIALNDRRETADFELSHIWVVFLFFATRVQSHCHSQIQEVQCIACSLIFYRKHLFRDLQGQFWLHTYVFILGTDEHLHS